MIIMIEIIILIMSIINLIQQHRIDKQEEEIEKLKIVSGSLIGKVFLGEDIDAKIEIRKEGE